MQTVYCFSGLLLLSWGVFSPVESRTRPPLLLALGWPALPAGSADLKFIDRTIVKEPKYASQPYYALLVFGPEAKTRVWLVLDGQVLYVDRNGNSDLTEANERIELDVEATKNIKVAPGEFKGRNFFNIGEVAGVRLQLHFLGSPFGPKSVSREILKAYRKELQENGWEYASLYRIARDGSRARNPVILCRNAKDAQVSHLNGPLTFTLRLGEEQTLQRGAEDNFEVSIGTHGVPTRNSRYPVFAPLTTSEVPSDAHPLAKFEFPHQDPDKLPIKVEVTLDRRC